jgi:enoyl-CoA hydratase
LAHKSAAWPGDDEMIIRSQHEGVLTLRLAYGKVSAIDVELLDALTRELDGFADDVRALVLTSTGSTFSAGLNLFRITRDGADYVQRLLPLLSRFLRSLFAFPRPVVAAADGHAIAGGCVIALAFDTRLMAEGPGRIGLPELLVGVPFPAAALEVVRFALPREKVQALIYTGRSLSAQEARGAGLVDQVVARRAAGAGAVGRPPVGANPAAGVSPDQPSTAGGGAAADRGSGRVAGSGGDESVDGGEDARADPRVPAADLGQVVDSETNSAPHPIATASIDRRLKARGAPAVGESPVRYRGFMQMDRSFCSASLARRRFLLAGTIAALVVLSPGPAPAQEPLLWGSLKAGPCSVGYRSLYQLDHTRQYDPEFATDPTKPPAHKPRPILLCIWYPAQRTDAKPMEYRQYLDVSSDDALIAPFAQRLSRHVVKVVSDTTVGKEPANRTPAETAAFERLLATRTFAVKDPPPAQGRFPVVLNHAGLNGVADDNSVLFELLASHGYVVLSSAYPNYYAEGVGITSDLHTSFRDLEFLSRYARGLPFADADQLGAMGHSWGAIAVLHWAALPDSPLRAFVTLDSGFEYGAIEDTGVEPLILHMRTNKGNIRAAALRFAGRPTLTTNFDFLEPHLKYAPDYQAAVASLTHNDYLTHGAIGPALLPEKWPDPKGARRTNYDRVCRHILLFFDATLKQQAAAREALQKSVRGETLDDGFKLKFKPAAPVPPTNGQLASYLKQHGLEKTLELIRSFPNFYPGRVAGAASILVQDGDATAALPALRWAVNEDPKSTTRQVSLGNALVVAGDRAGALAAYRKAAELFPKDDEMAKNERLREGYKYLIDKGLTDLGSSKPPKDR